MDVKRKRRRGLQDKGAVWGLGKWVDGGDVGEARVRQKIRYPILGVLNIE